MSSTNLVFAFYRRKWDRRRDVMLGLYVIEIHESSKTSSAKLSEHKKHYTKDVHLRQSPIK